MATTTAVDAALVTPFTVCVAVTEYPAVSAATVTVVDETGLFGSSACGTVCVSAPFGSRTYTVTADAEAYGTVVSPPTVTCVAVGMIGDTTVGFGV